MPDSIVINSPQGTSVQVGTWLMVDPGPDFGDKDLLKASLVENPLVDGGALAYESIGVRHMAIPLVLASGAAGLSLTQIESVIHDAARPGGSVDLQPQGVPSTDMVRFDILSGRLEPNYQVLENRVGVRHATLKLDVQPYGYWPTLILLASVASVGLPGRLIIPAASIIGDAPAQLAQIAVIATTATTFPGIGGSGGTAFAVDTIAWALSGHAASAFLNGPAWTVDSGGGSVADGFAPGATGRLDLTPNANGWGVMAHYVLAKTTVEPLFRGRYQAFGYFFPRVAASSSATDGWRSASTGQTYRVSLDAVPGQPQAAAVSFPMGSAAAVATVANNLAASPGYQLLDLGPISLPPIASGRTQDVTLRLWGIAPSTFASVASNGLGFGGVALLPIDGPAGILRSGIAYPTAGLINPNALGGFFISALDEQEFVTAAGAAFPAPTAGAIAQQGDYRGGLPLVGASTVALEILAAGRPLGIQPAYAMDVANDLPDAWWRFADSGLATVLLDNSGHGRALLASQVASSVTGSPRFLGNAPGPFGSYNPGLDDAFYANGIASVSLRLPSYAGFPTTGWTVECWVKGPAISPPLPTAILWNAITGSAGAQHEITLGYNGSGLAFAQVNGGASVAATQVIFGNTFWSLDTLWDHVAFVFSGLTNGGASPGFLSIYLNGNLNASIAVPSPALVYVPTVGAHLIGRASSAAAATVFGGYDVAELAVYPAALPASTIAARVDSVLAFADHRFLGAARSASGFAISDGHTAATTVASVSAPIHAGRYYAQVSVYYQPRFKFLKGF